MRVFYGLLSEAQRGDLVSFPEGRTIEIETIAAPIRLGQESGSVRRIKGRIMSERNEPLPFEGTIPVGSKKVLIVRRQVGVEDLALGPPAQNTRTPH